MKTRQILATGLIAALVTATAPINLMAGGQQNATISGTAKDEAKKPYTDYTTRARNVQAGQIAGTIAARQRTATSRCRACRPRTTWSSS